MVTLTQPNPSMPVAGENFEITARDGVGPYTFTYKIGEDDAQNVEQADPKLKIDIPLGKGGQSLRISVEDSTGEDDARSWTIQPQEEPVA